METFLDYAIPIYSGTAVIMFFCYACGALTYRLYRDERNTRIMVFWMFAMLVWPLVAVYYISKAVLLILVTGYKGALIVMKGE